MFEDKYLYRYILQIYIYDQYVNEEVVDDESVYI